MLNEKVAFVICQEFFYDKNRRRCVDHSKTWIVRIYPIVDRLQLWLWLWHSLVRSGCSQASTTVFGFRRNQFNIFYR